MKKKPSSKSAFFNLRVLLWFCLAGAVLVLAAFGALPGGSARPQQSAQDQNGGLTQAPIATAKSDVRASAIAATKVYGPRATAIFSLATTRAEQARQAESPNSATLTTDQQDYPPYAYVYFTGTGFQPGETVNMIVVELDPIQQSFEPWNVVADPNGNFQTSWYIFSDQFIGATMQATATGQSSGLNASAIFTDAVPPLGVAPVITPSGGFAIDGDLLANTPTSCSSPCPSPDPGFAPNQGDWLNGPGGTGGWVLDNSGIPLNTSTTYHFTDLYNNPLDDIFGGGGKWDDNPNTWTWVLSKPNAKNDINNALVHVAKDVNDDTWIIIAADRLSNNGDDYIDFEFLQGTLAAVGDPGGTGGPFTSSGPNCGRTVNDFVLTLQFVNGGTRPDFFVYRWEQVAGNSSCSPGTSYDYVDVTAATAGIVYAAVNTTTTSVPFGAFGSTTYLPNTFAEAAINLTKLIASFGASFDPCVTIGVNTVFVKTKTAQAFTADLKDFIAPLPLRPPLPIGEIADAGPDQSMCQGANNSTTFTMAGVAQPGGTSTITDDHWTCDSGDCTSVTIDNPDSVGPVPNNLNTAVHITGAPRTVTLRLTVNYSTGGCHNTLSDTVRLTVNRVDASSSNTPILCHGGTSTVTVSAIGGTAPYSGTGTFTRSAGTYSFTVTDANSCTATTTGNITEPGALVASNTAGTISCHGGTTTVSVSASGGTGAYSGTGTFTRSAGTYSFTVTDANSCTAVTSGSVSEPAVLMASSSNTPILCNGGSSTVTVSATGGTPPYQGTGMVSRSAGTYSFTVADAHSCTATTTGNITQPSAVTLSLQAGACSSGSNGSITATFGGGTSPYQVKIDAGSFFTATSPYTFTGLAGGSHTVTVKDANGCTKSNSTTVASCPRFCTLTQGAYGNMGGKYTYNGVKYTTSALLQLLTSPAKGGSLVVGVPGVRSLTITQSAVLCLDGDNACRIARLPANTTPASLPSGFGNQTLNACGTAPSCQTSPVAIPLQGNAQWQSVLLGQTVALTLNTRLDPNLPGLVLPSCVSIPASVLTTLSNATCNGGYGQTVSGLLYLANRGLAGQSTCSASLGDITNALNGINTYFNGSSNNNCPMCQQ